MRIVDLETKSLNSPRPAPSTARRLESRIEELTNQLQQQSSKDSLRMSRTVDRSSRDTKFQLAEAERQKARLEEEVKSYEERLTNMRRSMDELVSSKCIILSVGLVLMLLIANIGEQPSACQTPS